MITDASHGRSNSAPNARKHSSVDRYVCHKPINGTVSNREADRGRSGLVLSGWGIPQPDVRYGRRSRSG